MILLSVDPGIRGTGAILFSGDELIWAKYVLNKSDKSTRKAEAASQMAIAIQQEVCFAYISHIAVEWPQIYAARIRMGKSKGDPNDLLSLAAINAAVCAVFPVAKVSSYAPSEWKASMKKEITEPRIEARLSVYEKQTLSLAVKAAKSKAHNVWDAVGIGLHHLGRFERKRVFAT